MQDGMTACKGVLRWMCTTLTKGGKTLKRLFRGIRKAMALTGIVVISIPGTFMLGYAANALLGIWAIPLYVIFAGCLVSMYSEVKAKRQLN